MKSHDLESSSISANPAIPNPLAKVDTLTGLPLESLFREEVEDCLAQCETQSSMASLALLQLANFYEIRSWLGPTEANILLGEIVRTVSQSLPATVLACRCKNHEFALLFREEYSNQALQVMEKIRALVESTASSTIPPQLSLQCAMGLTTLNERTPSVDVAFARARLNISHTGNELNLLGEEYTKDHETVTTQIQQGLLRKGFNLLFQPIVSLDKDGTEQFEVRTQLDDSIGVTSSQLIYEVASQYALGERIDRQVIEKTFRKIGQSKGDAPLFTINISLDSLTSSTFLNWLRQALVRFAIPPQQIIVQISEIDILIAQHYLQQFSKTLYQLGISLSVRHFACTPDPLNYLPLLKLCQVKFDASLLTELHNQSAQRKRLREFTTALKARGIRPVAAMVEDATLLPLLWEVGISNLQGHCLEPPSADLQFEFPQEQVF